MYSLNIGLVVGATDLLEEVRSCLHDLPVNVVVEQRELGEPAAFFEKLDRVHPDVVLLGFSGVSEILAEVVLQIKATTSAPAVIVVNSSAAPEVILRSMRSGADEYVYTPLGADLVSALDRISTQRAKTRAGTTPRGKVFAFLSAKGGSGATTVACHVALELRRQTNLQVLLADFDVDHGLVGFLMKSQSRYSLMDAASASYRLDLSLWKALVSSAHGIEVLSAPAPSGVRDMLDPRCFRHIVPFVRAVYDWSVLDLGSGLSPNILAGLQEADEAFLVATTDIPSLHQTKQIVQSLLDTGIGQHHVHVILNRTPKRMEVTLEELDRMLGVPVYATFPGHESEVNEAYSAGSLLPPGSELGRHLARITARLAGLEKKNKKSRFAFLS